MGQAQAEQLPTLLTKDDICERYGIHKKTLDDWRGRGEFPPPIKIGPRLVRWRLADVEAYEADRMGVQ